LRQTAYHLRFGGGQVRTGDNQTPDPSFRGPPLQSTQIVRQQLIAILASAGRYQHQVLVRAYPEFLAHLRAGPARFVLRDVSTKPDLIAQGGREVVLGPDIKQVRVSQDEDSAEIRLHNVVVTALPPDLRGFPAGVEYIPQHEHDLGFRLVGLQAAQTGR